MTQEDYAKLLRLAEENGFVQSRKASRKNIYKEIFNRWLIEKNMLYVKRSIPDDELETYLKHLAYLCSPASGLTTAKKIKERAAIGAYILYVISPPTTSYNFCVENPNKNKILIKKV